MNYTIFFYVWIFIKLFVKCEVCSGCKIVNNICTHVNPFIKSCNPNCRPNLATLPQIPNIEPSDTSLTEEPFNPQCFLCPGIIEGQKYHINSNGDCLLEFDHNEKCKFMVYNTKQCLESCSNLKQMGDFCYQDCDSGNRKPDGDNNCICKSYYYIDSEDGKSLWRCYNQKCDSFHQSYNETDKQCFTSDDCDSNSNMNKTYEERDDMSGIYKCSERCNETQKYYNGHCVNICPSEVPYYYTDDEGIKICTEDCKSQNLYYRDTRECIQNCDEEEFISDDNRCITSCILPFYQYKDDQDKAHCTLNCTGRTKFKQEVEGSDPKTGQCVSHCDSQFYINDKCVNSTEKEKCFYKKEEEIITDSIGIDSISSDTIEENYINRQCLISCSEIPDYPCYIYGTKECIKCEVPGYCHHEREYELFPTNGTNTDLATDSFYFDPEEYICNCILYAMENNRKHCFKDEAACKSKGYFFRRGNECLKVCKPYFEVRDDVNDGLVDQYLRICFNSVDECKSEDYFYYNVDMLTCWNTCPDDMFSIQVDSDGYPFEDNTRSTCVKKCGKDFPKHTKGKNICKKECDANEFFTLDEPNICLSTCEGAYPSDTTYFGENNECLKYCDFNKFILTTTIFDKTHIRCVSKCADYGKFYVNFDQKCYDKCKDVEGDNYYYYNNNQRCLTSCLYNDLPEKFSYLNTSDVFEKEKCRLTNENKYYYEEDKIIRTDPCELFSPEDSFKCLYNCDGGKVLPNGTCTTECPPEYPYYENLTITIAVNSKEINILKCIARCPNYTLIYSNKCIYDCPKDYSINGTTLCYPNCYYWQKFDLATGKCVESCGDNKYYENTTYYGRPPISICKDKCLGAKKFIKDDEDPECVEKCPRKNNFIQKNNLCKTNCSEEEPYYILLSNDDYPIYQCLKFCPLEDEYKYVKYDSQRKGECLKSCPAAFNFSLEGDLIECLSSCPDGYYWDLVNYQCKKYNFCVQNTNQKQYYFNGTCYDLNGCKGIKYPYVEDFHCVDECKKNKYKKNSTVVGVIECIDKCGENEDEYIESGNYCVEKCPKEKNFIGNDKICKSQCDTGDGIYYYDFKVLSDYTIYTCSEKCSNATYYLEGYQTTQCFKECPPHLPFLSSNENRCYNNCLISPEYNFTIDKNCYSSCNLTYNYYYERNQTCLKSCHKEDFAFSITEYNYIFKCAKYCDLSKGYYIYTNGSDIKNKYCFKECPNDKKYAENNICVEHCSNEKKFFVKEFKHYEDNLQKICLTDCPKEYPYYTVYTEDGNDTYGCINTCEGYKVLNYSDRNINATLCLDSCPQTGYEEFKYQIIDKDNKTCYSICPPEKPYHKDLNVYSHDNNCYEKCPEETPFTDIGGIICKSEKDCEGKYIDYENKNCLDYNKCPLNRKFYSHFYLDENNKDDESKTKVICLDKCIEKYGKYLTPNGTCVKDCADSTDPLINKFGLINDPKNDRCICQNLYVINDNLKMECLQNSTNHTKCKAVSGIYSIKMFNSKECVKTCNNSNILSSTEDICYNSSHICNLSDLPDDRNTHLIAKRNGQQKCECAHKFYFTDDVEYPEFKKKVCLDFDGLCPKDYGKFIPETQECLETVKNCPDEFKYLFLGIFCLRDIPRNSTYNSTGDYYQCVEPNEYWHETTIGRGNFECIDKCLDNYTVYAPATNQCLTTCKGSIYPYFYENKCYNSCDNDKLLNIENGFITKIEGIEKYNIYKDYANYVCDCHNPWFYNDRHKKICADSMVEYSIKDCNNFTNPNPNPIYDHLVRSTLQCVDHCPKYSTYTFNYDCFVDCDEAAYYYHYVTYKNKTTSYECQCQNLWFYEPNGKIQCIDPNVTECVVYDYERKFFDKKYFDKKYLVNETNECVNQCPKGSYIFNYVCYEKCPKDSKDSLDINDPNCTCNTEVGYWYEYEKYNLTYLQCALEQCPLTNNNSDYIRENLLERESKCLISCKEDEEFPFSLRKICVKECPFYTFIGGELNDTCIFLDLSDKRVDTLEKLKGAASVQVPEIYENSKRLGGYIINKLNTSLQIYSVDKNDSLKDLSFKSNLTYIDFGTCLEKLILDKNISDNESILITKYDILPEANVNIPPDTSENHKNDKYLINPVEYELYSSLTNERLDALVCEPYEILISYPLCLSKFDKYIDGINQNEYRKKFDLGRELYLKDNEVDIFNYNNSVYTHFCKDLEIHGKDLVFEDRYKYLYPNNKLLCESNCTYNNTDYLTERVNCYCTYKNVFDFNRTEEEINDILNNPDFYVPTQSSTNAEIIKCLFNFTLKQAVAKNEMFYCCTIMTVAQLAMVLISSFVSIKKMINDIRHILNKVNIKNYFLKKNKFFRNNNLKTDNMVSSTNKALNNPPKKNEYSESESNDKNKINNDDINTKLESNISKSNKDSEMILDKDKIYSATDNKAEYIPPDYNFKFFRLKDKGVMKKIERNKIPFEINPDTKYLIERREGIDYPEDYLEGPYFQNQNMLVIVDEKVKKIKKKHKPNIDTTLSFHKDKNNDIENTKDDKTEIKSKINDASTNLYETKSNLRDNKFFETKSNLRDNKFYETNFKMTKEKNFMSTKQTKSNLKSTNMEKVEFDPEGDLKLNDEGHGFFESIRREQIILRINYEKYLIKKHNIIYIKYLAEILDKIYFIKICLFLKKFDIFCVQISLYLFYHILLISLLCGFFTIKVIKKIWEQDNFPGINFYLLYGLIANLIVWVIYQMLGCLLDFNGKIKDMITLKYELIENQYREDFDRDNIHDKNEDIYKDKYDELIYQMKCRIAIYFVLAFIFTLFFTIYLISFFAFYTGTKHRVLEAYYISIIEILLIKICYGILLASLRLLSEKKRIKFIYNIVYFFDKHIS